MADEPDWADFIAKRFCSAGLMDANQALAFNRSPKAMEEATQVRNNSEKEERKRLAQTFRVIFANGINHAADIAEFNCLALNGPEAVGDYITELRAVAQEIGLTLGGIVPSSKLTERREA